MIPLILLRPQPGNDASAARARAMAMEVVQAPLFETRPVDVPPQPEGPFDAILLTSANSIRFAPAAFLAMAHVPLYAVGGASARAAAALGLRDIRTGGGDAASTVPMIAADGHRRILHICGADVKPFDDLGLHVTRHIVYRAQESDPAALYEALGRLGAAVVAVHSPRAGQRLAALVEPARRASLYVAAISHAAAQACGEGWAGVAVSTSPDDTALLGCAETLCNCARQ